MALCVPTLSKSVQTSGVNIRGWPISIYDAIGHHDACSLDLEMQAHTTFRLVGTAFTDQMHIWLKW